METTVAASADDRGEKGFASAGGEKRQLAHLSPKAMTAMPNA